MKAFANANARTPEQAVALAAQARMERRLAAFSGGGSDLLGLLKDRVIAPDVIINLRTVPNQASVTTAGGSTTMGGLITLDALGRHDLIRRRYSVLAEAAATVATPQIRNVATLAGNVCQRPWCWYYRNGFPCYKAGGTRCFSVAGENQFHAIFGGGPSYIVHPSDLAPALVALEASFEIVGPSGAREIPASEFFALPRQDPARENVLAPDELLASVRLREPASSVRSTYHKIMDREAWTHAIVSAAVVLEMDQQVCRHARVVLGGVAPIPWRLPAVEDALLDRRVTPELAARAGDLAVEGARALSRNAYKIPLTRALVRRTVLELATRDGGALE